MLQELIIVDYAWFLRLDKVILYKDFSCASELLIFYELSLKFTIFSKQYIDLFCFLNAIEKLYGYDRLSAFF